MKNLTTTVNPTGVEVETGKLETTKGFELETSKVAMGVLGTLAALIGIWGLACLIGGIASCENLLDLGRAWFAAVTGSGY